MSRMKNGISQTRQSVKSSGVGRSQDIFSTEPSGSQSQRLHSLSQSLQSQRQSASQRSRKESVINVKEIANEVLLFFLNYHYCMKPIKKTVITKYLKNLGSTTIFNEVMGIVKENLYEDIGLNVIEKDDGKAIEYHLTNALVGEVDLSIKPNCILEEHKMVLLFLVLLVINKNGNRMKEAPLLEFLKKLNIIKDVKKPIAKGYFKGLDVEKFIRQELTSISYLLCNEIELDEDEKVYEYCWGVRADNEISIEKLDKFYDEIDALELNDPVTSELDIKDECDF